MNIVHTLQNKFKKRQLHNLASTNPFYLYGKIKFIYKKKIVEFFYSLAASCRKQNLKSANLQVQKQIVCGWQKRGVLTSADIFIFTQINTGIPF